MLKSGFAKSIFIISCAIAVIYPLINIYFIFPSFSSLVVENAEKEAELIARHLLHMLAIEEDELKNSASIKKTTERITKDFNLMKIKVFSAEGEVVYSTDPGEVGEINTKNYFSEIVSLGKTYTKVVRKDSRSLEGQIVTADVVETYVPIMIDGKFAGAFEVYYDITARGQKLNNIVFRASFIPLALMFGFLMAMIIILVRADRKQVGVDTKHLAKMYRSPFYLLMFMIISIFIAEALVMLFLSAFPSITHINQAMMDSVLLVMIISPTLYFFLLRPLLLHIAGRRRAEKQVSRIAFYDELTMLPNRVLFQDRLTQVIARAGRYHEKLGLLLLDVDNFKRINDSFEHRIGDTLLREIAARLRSCLRKTDSVARASEGLDTNTIARLGGDEFAVLLSAIKNFGDASLVARRIIDELSLPFSINNREMFITVSIGIGIYPQDGRDFDTLLKNTDTAMYYAKEQGRNQYQYYEREMNASALEKITMESDLRKATEREELLLYYQPQVNAISGKIAGMEALIRWRHNERGMIAPMDFIPLAEQTGLINPITTWVIETACQQHVAWQRSGVPTVPVSVNLTSHQFIQDDFIETIVRIMSVTGIKPQNLMLEITESTLMEDTELAISNLHTLTEMGLRLIVDDFGTGYSSLSYLKRFPIYAIKIDRSFIKDIVTNTNDAAIANAIISVANTLGMKVIAEGVETRQQYEYLREHGCDKMQGYLFSRPLPAEEASDILTGEMEVAGKVELI